MEKLLDLIGLKKPIYKLSDFEPALRNHYILEFAADAALFLIGVIISIVNGSVTLVLMFVAVFAAAFLFHLYGFIQLLGGQVVYLDGICTEVEKNVKTVLKKTVFGTSKISVLSDDHIYEVPVRHNSIFKEDMKVRVYLTENNIYKKDEDTFDIPYPVLVLRLKGARKHQNQEAQEAQTNSEE